jgi:hypothetical protein
MFFSSLYPSIQIAFTCLGFLMLFIYTPKKGTIPAGIPEIWGSLICCTSYANPSGQLKFSAGFVMMIPKEIKPHETKDTYGCSRYGRDHGHGFPIHPIRPEHGHGSSICPNPQRPDKRGSQTRLDLAF